MNTLNKTTQQGLIISIEGIEGSGKTSIIKRLEKELTFKGFKVNSSREPGGSMLSEKIRDILINENMDSLTETLLFASARREHLLKKIIPSIKNNEILLLDRFIDSSLAYQGFARGIGIDQVLYINKMVLGDYMPDLTLYLDIDPKIAMDRLYSNNRELNRLDKEDLSFYYKAQEGFNLLISYFPDRIVKINANQDILNVTLDCVKVICLKLENYNRKGSLL